MFVHTYVHMSSKTSVRAHVFKTSDMEQRQQGSEILEVSAGMLTRPSCQASGENMLQRQ